jgi:hypothetical protein
MQTTTMRMAALLFAGLAWGPIAHGETRFAYTTPWQSPDGTVKAVTFDGVAERGRVSGTLRLGQTAATLKGIIAIDGSVSGTILRPDGTPLATFSGQRDKDGVLAGTVAYGGTVRPWRAPGLALPDATTP